MTVREKRLIGLVLKGHAVIGTWALAGVRSSTDGLVWSNEKERKTLRGQGQEDRGNKLRNRIGVKNGMGRVRRDGKGQGKSRVSWRNHSFAHGKKYNGGGRIANDWDLIRTQRTHLAGFMVLMEGTRKTEQERKRRNNQREQPNSGNNTQETSEP